MNLEEWATDWKVPAAAVADLRRRMGIGTEAAPQLKVDGKPGSESRQQSLVRLDAAENRVWLTRNNVGVLIDKTGRPVRFGLANESKEQNEAVKSADLIGIRAVLIGPQHFGKVIGQLVSREVKHEGWVYTGDEHEVAQLAWANFILSKGGDAAFCTGPGSFQQLQVKS